MKNEGSFLDFGVESSISKTELDISYDLNVSQPAKPCMQSEKIRMGARGERISVSDFSAYFRGLGSPARAVGVAVPAITIAHQYFFL